MALTSLRTFHFLTILPVSGLVFHHSLSIRENKSRKNRTQRNTFKKWSASPQRGTARLGLARRAIPPGWCQLWCMAGTPPSAQGHREGTTSLTDKRHLTSLHSINISVSLLCAGGVDPVICCGAHTQRYMPVCVCVAGDRWGMKLSDAWQCSRPLSGCCSLMC